MSASFSSTDKRHFVKKKKVQTGGEDREGESGGGNPARLGQGRERPSLPLAFPLRFFRSLASLGEPVPTSSGTLEERASAETCALS